MNPKELFFPSKFMDILFFLYHIVTLSVEKEANKNSLHISRGILRPFAGLSNAASLQLFSQAITLLDFLLLKRRQNGSRKVKY